MPLQGTIQSISETFSTLFGRERWHKKHAAGWIGDAIYGVNDGLGAIFGIIAGVAGYTANSNTVLMSGVFGALASTLSMGAGAWLATKSETELRQSQIAQIRTRIAINPEHEMKELALLYELKGFSEQEGREIAQRISRDTELFVKTMTQEELGFQDESAGSHWRSAFIGSISTLFGGFIPLTPFFFLTGINAMIAAAGISILAHFAVGAAKSLVTVRSWWISGMEMTFAGIIVGVVAYGLGIFGTQFIHL